MTMTDSRITSTSRLCNDASKVIAQTLFLGASVSSINLSKGWSGQTSQLTVNLIEDPTSAFCAYSGNNSLLELQQYTTSVNARTISANDVYIGDHQTNTPEKDKLDHYHTCSGYNCYITPSGNATPDTHPGDYIVPGKVFYEFVAKNGNNQSIYSKYWKNADPGFFGVRNHIRTDGTYINTYDESTENLNKPYDIIGTPVYFKLGDISFGGIVQSWNRTVNSGGKGFSVVINGMESILSQCFLILGNFAGTVYSNIDTANINDIWGGPRNYAGRDDVKYWDVISKGNIPNVFNIYGFLESMGKGGFGGARLNEDGIEANSIIRALKVLTSSDFDNSNISSIFNDTSTTSDLYKDYGKKSAFSPFGRIVVKCMQEQDTYIPITPAFARFGVIPPTLLKASSIVNNQQNFCQFLLDLSELPDLPADYRISGPIISVLDLINQITEETGYDYHISLLPVTRTYTISTDAGQQSIPEILNIIKVHTIPRLYQPKPNIISNTIKELQCLNYPISSITNGQEYNETQAKNVLIGGKQQRLLQAKSLRLAYTQSSFIFNPKTNTFIDYMRLGDNDTKNRKGVSAKPYHHGKVRIPTPLSVRNTSLSNRINPDYSGLYSLEDSIRNSIYSQRWDTTDNDWNDNLELVSSQSGIVGGDYKKTVRITHSSPVMSDTLSNPGNSPITESISTTKRFIPIYYDVICPFFGYTSDNEFTLNPSAQDNEHRRIRPVYFDTWTGQLIVVLRVEELPVTNVDLEGFYTIRGVSSFILTENEIRAALAGFDNFLVYSLAKTYKNDLIEMVRRAYEKKYKDEYVNMGLTADLAQERAKEKTDWYWRLIGGNIAGLYNQSDGLGPDKGDGSASIEEEVMQDLQILHGFLSKIAEFYGKKYMVTAPSLRAYRDTQFSDFVLPTIAGNAYVFNGGGKLYYNYEPTNDGAWEEYGNIIDDTIAVGNNDWYNLTDDQGKIKPIVAYNANDTYDYVRYQACRLTAAKLQDYLDNASYDPFWNFEAFEYIRSLRDGTCQDNKFLFPGLNLSSLSSDGYILKEVAPLTNWTSISMHIGAPTGANFSFVTGTTTQRDAWGKNISGNMKKIYLNTSVEESFSFIDPTGLSYPKIIVDAPGITINSTAEKKAKDPNRTVISNVAVEDLSIYLHIVPSGNWDKEWIKYMLYYISDIHRDSGGILDEETDMIGSFAASANQSANFVEIAPKAAHPFFIGIPIRYNQYSYGPWTNFPYDDRENIFPSGDTITQSSSLPPTCTRSGIIPTEQEKTRAIDNWILPTKLEVDDTLVPWTYGGMSALDNIAYNQIAKNLNYQSVIETAQIDIPGLPIFGLGMGFNPNAMGKNITGLQPTAEDIVYKDYKDSADTILVGNVLDFTSGYENTTFTQEENTLTYKVFSISGWNSDYTEGPIVTNIQTAIGENGIVSTYSFRTYTPKIGLFNRQNSDRIKKISQLNFRRNKQIARLNQQAQNINDVQSRFLEEKKFENSTLSSDLTSKLFGWSPSTVLVANAMPYIRYPDRLNEYLEPTGLFSGPTGLDTSSVPAPGSNPFRFKTNSDKGVSGVLESGRLTYDLANVTLSDSLRYHTSVGMYELKEVEAQAKQNRGLQSIMSLDGIFSPVSFFPTLKNSTYSYGLYDTISCPFCKYTKKLKASYSFRYSAGNTTKESGIYLYCDKCGRPTGSGPGTNNFANIKGSITTTSSNQSLEILPPYIIGSGTDINILMQFKSLAGSSSSSTSSSSTSSAGSAGISIPINLVTLNPIVVPEGPVSNTNVQYYTGVHPDGSGTHEDLSFGIFSSGYPRYFHDRCRHSIEIVGRGSTKPKQISIHNNLTLVKSDHQVDFYKDDIILNSRLREANINTISYQMNQRFMGMRGPIVMHGWGYDLEGYPIPNAADEPYEVDRYGRPRRFKLKVDPAGSAASGNYLNDMENGGGFMDTTMTSTDPTTGYQGDIISKTQKWKVTGATASSYPAIGATGGKWSEKKKLKEFYLNWAERPDLWPVGPIDLRWDSDRRVWTTKTSDVSSIYKMVYVVLEEDMVAIVGSDETYPTRGFLDDLEYSTQPLDNGYRRVVYVKDRSSYSAPRGAKLLCRYDKTSGFYEPVSKPSFAAKGTIAGGANMASIEMAFAPGLRQGESYPTMLVNFDNPFNLSTSGGMGLFTYLNGKWVLTSGSA